MDHHHNTPSEHQPSAHAQRRSPRESLHSSTEHRRQAHQNSDHHEKHSGDAGHREHAGHSEAMFQRPFWISLVLTIPVVIYSEMFQHLLSYHAPAFPGSAYLEPILGSIIFWYGGWIFLSGAISELRTRRPGMMTLVSLAITTAYIYSVVVTFHIVEGMAFYWELATLVTIMLLGHWMEMRAIGSAQSALRALAKLLPDQAERITEYGTQQVAVGDLKPGDRVLIRPGGQVPADATVTEGTSEVNESMITGESRPVNKQPGDEIIAGTVNGNGSLRAEITHTGEQTMLAGIMRLVEEAQQSRSQAQALADRAASILTYIALGVAILTFVTWAIVQGINDRTLEYVVTTLVVACPHALGLAIPLVIAISTTLSAKNGVLVRDRLALEQARKLSIVVFDKTGTLTKGEQGLVGMLTEEPWREEETLALAAAVEGDSEHMMARALVEAAQQRSLTLPAVADFQALPGRGVQANVGKRTLLVGGPRLLEDRDIQLAGRYAQAVQEWGDRGQSVIFLVEDTRILAAFALADVIRPESREAVANLQQQGVRVAMLTGDSQEVANWVAQELHIDEVFAQVLPEHKHEKIEELKRQGVRGGTGIEYPLLH